MTSDGLTGPARLAKLESGIVEAYRARYLGADRSELDVYAVHFDDAALTAAAPLNRLRNRPGRTIVIGATAVWVSPGNGGDCFRAVADYIASLQGVSLAAPSSSTRVSGPRQSCPCRWSRGERRD